MSNAETKSSSTSGNVTMPTFYTNQLPPSTNLSNDLFDKSADLSKKSIERNKYNQNQNNHRPDIASAKVFLVNQLSSSNMNCKYGTRKEWDQEKSKWQVELDDGNKTVVYIESDNLEDVIARVRVIDPQDTTVNGKLGMRSEWNEKQDTFTVVLDNGQNIAGIHPKNLLKVKCNCEIVKSYNLGICADCEADLGPIRLAEEQRRAQIVKDEDAAFFDRSTTLLCIASTFFLFSTLAPHMLGRVSTGLLLCGSVLHERSSRKHRHATRIKERRAETREAK